MKVSPAFVPWMLVATVAFAQAGAKNAELQRGQKFFEDLKYADAARAFDAAWQTPGNDRETVLEILKLQAVVAGTLGQQDRARSLFRALLYLAPEFVLPEGDLGPKVLSLFYEAKGRTAVEGALKFEPGPVARGEQVYRLSVLLADSQKLGKIVRFHTRSGGQDWAVTDAAAQDGEVSIPVESPAVEWWAELVGDKDRGLARVGSAGAPIVSAKLAGPAAGEPAPAGGSGRNLKPFAYGLAGAGAVAAVVGLVFGIRSNNEKNAIVAAQRDAAGIVTGVTRQRALELNDQQRTSATVANTLFVVGALLVGTGVVLYVLPGGAKVTATPGGVAVTGSLP